MGMVLNIIGVLSIIAFIGCILFIIYKLIRHGKQSLNLNYFLGIVICVLFFVISIEAGKFYPIENTVWQKIIQVTNTETERTFDETEEVQKIMAGANLTEEEAQKIINIFKKCGFEEIYFVGACNILDDKEKKGYTFEYDGKSIYVVLLNNGGILRIFSDNCCFVEGDRIKHHFKDWYLSEEDKKIFKERAKAALKEYADKTFFSTDDWRVIKVIDGQKGYLITSADDDFYVHIESGGVLDYVTVDDVCYYPKVMYKLKSN